MKISVIADHRVINGSFLNLLDFQQYLKDFENYTVSFYCNEIKELQNVVKKSFRYYTFDYISKIKDIMIIKDVVITDFKSLISMYQNKKRIITSKIIVFDTLELTLFLNDVKNNHFYPNINLYDMLKWHKFSNITFLMPSCNLLKFKEKYPDLESYEFYKKIYIPKINEIKYYDNGKLFYRIHNYHDIPDIKEEDISKLMELTYPNSVGLIIKDGCNLFDYNGYIYKKQKESNYLEQFGRLIFEFFILDKKIYWFDDPYEYNDGLRDYLIHYSDDGDIIKEMMSEPYKEKIWR